MDSESRPGDPIFIPVAPASRRRFGMMISAMFPGLLLVLSVFQLKVENGSDLLIVIFSFLAGVFLVIASVLNYRGKKTFLSAHANGVMVFSGFVLIAQASQLFNPLKGFQPAVLYALSGTVYIFMGVMVPEQRNRQGFYIHEGQLIYKRRFFKKYGPVETTGLSQIHLQNGSLRLVYADGKEGALQIPGAKMSQVPVNRLRQILNLPDPAINSGAGTA